MTRPQDWIGMMEPDGWVGRLRLWLARRLCPDSHRVVEIGDIVTDRRVAVSDLYIAVQSLENGLGVHPVILVNAARLLRADQKGGQLDRLSGADMTPEDIEREAKRAEAAFRQ